MHFARYLQIMPKATSHPEELSYGEVRSALSRRAAFESHQEGVGKTYSYVLHVRPRSTRFEPFSLTGPDLTQLLREALTRLPYA
jgi:hypothetical protein